VKDVGALAGATEPVLTLALDCPAEVVDMAVAGKPPAVRDLLTQHLLAWAEQHCKVQLVQSTVRAQVSDRAALPRRRLRRKGLPAHCPPAAARLWAGGCRRHSGNPTAACPRLQRARLHAENVRMRSSRG
jgi:hypothetical protein